MSGPKRDFLIFENGRYVFLYEQNQVLVGVLEKSRFDLLLTSVSELKQATPEGFSFSFRFGSGTDSSRIRMYSKFNSGCYAVALDGPYEYDNFKKPEEEHHKLALKVVGFFEDLESIHKKQLKVGTHTVLQKLRDFIDASDGFCANTLNELQRLKQPQLGGDSAPKPKMRW